MKKAVSQICTVLLLLAVSTSMAFADTIQTVDLTPAAVTATQAETTTQDKQQTQTSTTTPTPVESTPINLVPTSDEISYDQNGNPFITMVYEVDKSVDFTNIVESKFKRDGYLYTQFSMTKDSVSSNKTKHISVPYQVPLDATKVTDALTEALKKFGATIEYEENGLTGTLLINPGTLFVTPINERTVTSVQKVVKNYTYEYNEDEQIPELINENGSNYSLASFTWAEGELDEESLLPRNYRCTAIYTKNVSSIKNDGYMATVEYTGDVSSDEVIAYTVTYKGALIQEPGFFARLFGKKTSDEVESTDEITTVPVGQTSSKSSNFNPVILLIIAFVLALGVLGYTIIRAKRSILHVLYRDEFSGEDQKLQDIKLTKDLKVVIDTSRHPECNHYTIEMNQKKAKSLNGQLMLITADVKTMQHTIEANDESVYRIFVNLEDVNVSHSIWDIAAGN